MTNLRPRSSWIVGVDGSGPSQLALDWAVTHAGQRSAIVEVARTWDFDVNRRTPQSFPARYEGERRSAEADIARLKREYRDVEVIDEYSIVAGEPGSVLVDKSADADLVVVGSRGFAGVERLAGGSVSRYCASHAQCPLVVVPFEFSIKPRIGRVVVGMDGSANAKAALRWAIGFASPDADVTVVGAVEHSIRSRLHAAEAEAEAEERFRSATDECLDDLGSVTVVHHWAGDTQPVDALLSTARHADLLVVGARGRSKIGAALLGSVSTDLLDKTPCPLAVIPTASD